MCKHGNQCAHRDPKEQQWVQSSNANLVTTFDTCNVTVYCRPSAEDCVCKKFYQGSHKFILNLTNETLVTNERLYKMHFDLLLTHANFHGLNNTSNHAYDCMSLKTHVPYKTMCLAYRAFLGLLRTQLKNAYWCQECSDVDIIVLICDGIQQGPSG